MVLTIDEGCCGMAGMSEAEFWQIVRYMILCGVAAVIACQCRKGSMEHLSVPRKRDGWLDALMRTVIAMFLGTLSPVPYGVGIWFFPSMSEWSGLSFNVAWTKVLAVALAWLTSGWIGWADGCVERKARWERERDRMLYDEACSAEAGREESEQQGTWLKE